MSVELTLYLPTFAQATALSKYAGQTFDAWGSVVSRSDNPNPKDSPKMSREEAWEYLVNLASETVGRVDNGEISGNYEDAVNLLDNEFSK